MKKSLLVTLLILLSLASPCFADTFQLNLKNGLNYISIPIGNAWNIKDILDQIPATTKQVAYWSTDNSRYFMYANDPVFDQFSTFEYGKGYWIYLKDASNMSLTLNGSQPVGYSLNLKKGWNAIGCTRTREAPIEEALLPLKMGVDYSSVWRYSGAAYPYQQYSAKTKEFTTLKPGEGYWIYMIKDAVLISPPAKPTINSPVSPTANNSQAITGTRVSNTLTIVVTCPGSTVGTVSYPSSTTWSCTLSNLTHGANDIVCQAKNSGGYLSDPATASITYNHPPQLGSVTPSSGASNPGEINSFITSYIDTDAWQDIKSAQVIFGTSLADPKMLL
ncbi:MAG: hypothetical protein NTY47_04100, partial [Candidatus Omnitrophica bacterium]|nr:hypothetical protein [Candidatus Omnitrophota bacterium]